MSPLLAQLLWLAVPACWFAAESIEGRLHRSARRRARRALLAG